jgi:hypothetical protein
MLSDKLKDSIRKALLSGMDKSEIISLIWGEIADISENVRDKFRQKFGAIADAGPEAVEDAPKARKK